MTHLSPLLAQIGDASPQHIKDFLIICLAISSPVIALFTARRSRIEPQPLEITQPEKPTTRDLCASKHSEIVTRFTRVEQDIQNLYREIKIDRTHFDSINESRTKETFNHIESVRHELSEKIDTIAPLVIATLKNTKNLI